MVRWLFLRVTWRLVVRRLAVRFAVLRGFGAPCAFGFGFGLHLLLREVPPPPVPPPPLATGYLAFLWWTAFGCWQVLLFAFTGLRVERGPFAVWPRLAVAPLVPAFLCRVAFFWHTG